MAETLRSLYLRARAQLAALPKEDAERDARLICQEALRLTPAQFVTQLSQTLDPPQGMLDHLWWMVSQRSQRKPLSHIFGYSTFWGRRFEVTGATLAPRGDTETLIAEALKAPFEHVLDLGTGTGALAITLLAEQPYATGVAVDFSQKALEVARRNAAAHTVEARLDLLHSDWFAAVAGRFDLIVCNPPYIDRAVWETLEPEVRLYEPETALTPGADGLQIYRQIVAQSPAFLRPNGRLLFEVGYDQGGAVEALLKAAGFGDVVVINDLSGHGRVVCAKAPNVGVSLAKLA